VKNYLVGLIVIFGFTLAGCDTVEGMRDMKDTQVQLKAIIKEEIGVESIVGFNLNDGVLIDVTIVVNAKDVANRSVSELERAAQSAVKQSFESKPREIYIQIATTAE
jgi:hypothetical protein